MDRRNRILSGFLAVAALIAFLEMRTPDLEDPQTVNISPEFRQFVENQLRASGRSELSAEAIDRAIEQAIEEEILYREGLSLGLEQDDLIIKRRIVQKMRFMVEAATPLLEPSQEQLEDYLRAHPEQFQTAESVQLEHVFFSRGRRGDRAMLEASEWLLHMQMDNAGDAHPLSGGMRTVTSSQLTRELGSQLAAEVLKLPTGEWSKPLASAMGVHLIRTATVNHGRVMTLEEAGNRLVAAVREHQRERMNEAAIQAILSRYQVRDAQ